MEQKENKISHIGCVAVGSFLRYRSLLSINLCIPHNGYFKKTTTAFLCDILHFFELSFKITRMTEKNAQNSVSATELW